MSKNKDSSISSKQPLRRCLPLTLMALPGLILLLLFNYLPMFGVVLAFKKLNVSKGIWGSDWVGLENFRFLFESNNAWQITRNTILYNFVFIVLGVVIPVFLAIVLSELRNKRTAKVYQTVFMVPYFLSWVVVSFMFFTLLSMDRGLVNGFLTSLGLPAVSWYSDPSGWPIILIMAQVWKVSGYSTVMYLGSIVSISGEYYEAALLDGASKWKQITHITLPFLKPMMIVLTMLAVGKVFYADFGLFYQVPRDSGALFPVTQVIDTYVYRALKVTGNTGMAAAANFYQSIVGFVLVLGSNLIVRKLDKDSALF